MFGLDFASYLDEQLEAASSLSFPLYQYQQDPVGFAHDILGVRTWSKQTELLESFRDHKRGAVPAGRKVSKSCSVAIIALWAYCCWDRAQVILVSTTGNQIEGILWFGEILRLVANSGKCAACREADEEAARKGFPPGPRPCPHSAVIPETPGKRAQTGMQSADFRSIVGRTAKSGEAAQGFSGRLFYLVDEASGVPDHIIHAITGNLAGGGWMWLFGNPTRSDGEFARMIKNPRPDAPVIQISSEESPNVVEGREVIFGLATHEWIEERKEVWGEDSALYKVHVKGEIAEGQDGKVLGTGVLADAVERWNDPDTEAEGPLFIGIDCAGEGGHGDESVFTARRGWKVLEIRARRALTAEMHVAECLAMIGDHQVAPSERPTVVVDVEGDVGTKVRHEFRAYTEAHPQRLRFVPFYTSWNPYREADVYYKNRDLLWANGARWIRDGGAIPDDPQLLADLNAPAWEQMGTSKGPRLRITDKSQLRKADKLGRSPDRGESLLLSLWEPQGLDEQLDVAGIGKQDMSPQEALEEHIGGTSIYDATDAFYGG